MNNIALGQYVDGTELKKPEILFQRIEKTEE